MAVTVRFFGRLRGVLGRDELSLEPAPATLREAIERMARLDRRVKEELLDEAGNLDYSYALFLGGERVEGLDTPLQDGDELAITSIIAGGQDGNSSQAAEAAQSLP